MNKPFLTTSEFAKTIGVHIQTLRNWDETGKLKPHHKTPGGRRYYTREQAQTYLAETDELLTINKFAEAIGVHAQTLRRWDETNQLKPHHKTAGGTRWYAKSQIQDYFGEKNND